MHTYSLVLTLFVSYHPHIVSMVPLKQLTMDRFCPTKVQEPAKKKKPAPGKENKKPQAVPAAQDALNHSLSTGLATTHNKKWVYIMVDDEEEEAAPSQRRRTDSPLATEGESTTTAYTPLPPPPSDFAACPFPGIPNHSLYLPGASHSTRAVNPRTSQYTPPTAFEARIESTP